MASRNLVKSMAMELRSSLTEASMMEIGRMGFARTMES